MFHKVMNAAIKALVFIAKVVLVMVVGVLTVVGIIFGIAVK